MLLTRVGFTRRQTTIRNPFMAFLLIFLFTAAGATALSSFGCPRCVVSSLPASRVHYASSPEFQELHPVRLTSSVFVKLIRTGCRASCACLGESYIVPCRRLQKSSFRLKFRQALLSYQRHCYGRGTDHGFLCDVIQAETGFSLSD